MLLFYFLFFVFLVLFCFVGGFFVCLFLFCFVSVVAVDPVVAVVSQERRNLFARSIFVKLFQCFSASAGYFVFKVTS